jgi:hypothetical protein
MKSHPFPLDKPFERQKADTPLAEIALRLIVNFYSESPYVIGTATVICGNCLVSAKHVLTDIMEKMPVIDGKRVDEKNHICAAQILPGPEYVIWDIVEIIACPNEDIIFLRTGTNPGLSNPDMPLQWKQPLVNPFAPETGKNVAAFGYRRGAIQTSKNSAGGPHIDLNDEGMMSVGIVQEIYDWKRDNVMLPFPCYRVNARFDAGMSGGPVFEETGALCGIICAGTEGAHLDGEPVSYVSMLWPLFKLIINADRGNNYPRGIHYPAIELAYGGQIKVPDLQRLDEWFKKHIGPPPVLS